MAQLAFNKFDYFMKDVVIKNGKVQVQNPIETLSQIKFKDDVNADKPLPPVSVLNRLLWRF